MANKVGRPPMFSDPEELQRKVEEYFVYIQGESDTRYKVDSDDEGNPNDEEEIYWIRKPEPPTITGLCLFLGFDSRQSFYDYGSIKEFSYTIKRARLMIESEYEKSAQFAKTPAFHIFALKNLGWSDRTEIDNTHHIGDFKISDVIKFTDKDG